MRNPKFFKCPVISNLAKVRRTSMDRKWMPIVDHLTRTQIQFVVEALYNTDIHELAMPGDRPKSDRYQKEEDKFLSIFAYYIFIWPISNRLNLIILLLQTCNGKWLSTNKQ